MEMKIRHNDKWVIYEFAMDLDEIANAKITPEAVKHILELEKSISVANQLEILLEYYHAIEGTDRITELSSYLRMLHHTYQYAQNPKFSSGPINMSAIISAYVTSMAQSPPFKIAFCRACKDDFNYMPSPNSRPKCPYCGLII